MFSNEDSTIIQAVYDAEWDGMKIVIDLRKDLKKVFEDVMGDYKDDFEIQFLSLSCMTRDIVDGTVSDMMTLDIISLVLGFVIVWLFIRQVSLLIISVVNLVESLLISFAISYFLTASIDIPSFAEAIQSATVIALTFDYSLFLFSNVRESMYKNCDARTVVRNMLGSSGHVVLVSGFCLALTFAFQCICPVDIIISIGVCTALTIIIIMLVSLTNTTAMLSLFPKFFLHQNYKFHDLFCATGKDESGDNVDLHAHCSDCGVKACCIERKQPEKSDMQKFIDKFTRAFGGQVEDKSDNKSDKKEPTYKSSKWIGGVAMLVVVAITCIFIYPVVKCEYTTSLELAIPKKSDTLEAIKDFGARYGDGLASPFYLVLNRTNAGTTDTLLND